MSEVNIPEGYKQTEFGCIPEDWEVIELGELFDSSISRNKIRPSTLVTFIGMQDVSEDAKLKTQNIVTYENVKSGFTYFERNDVLLAKITPCFENGKGCHTKHLKTKYGFGSTEFHVLRATSQTDSDFLYYWTTKEDFRVKLESTMVGSAGHRRVPLLSVANFKIPIPPLPEQTAIATALSDMDNLIASLEKLIAKKEAMKTGAMQQLLTGETRLPEFANDKDGKPKGFKQTELGLIPEDWEVKRLGEVCDLKSGHTITSVDIHTDALYPCFGGNGIRGYTFDYNLEGENVLIGRQGALCGNIEYVMGKAFATEHALIVNMENNISPKWLSYILFRMNLNQYSESSAQPGLSAYKLKKLKIFVPSKPEQTAIATILSDMDAEIEALQTRLHKTLDIKQGMMQQLLTGKVRLLNPNADKSA